MVQIMHMVSKNMKIWNMTEINMRILTEKVLTDSTSKYIKKNKNKNNNRHYEF